VVKKTSLAKPDSSAAATVAQNGIVAWYMTFRFAGIRRLRFHHACPLVILAHRRAEKAA
jgi:hypothetical protein